MERREFRPFRGFKPIYLVAAVEAETCGSRDRGKAGQSAAEPATGYRYPEGHATVTRGAVEDQCTDPEGGTAACLKDVAGTRTRQSARTAGQYFNPLASAKSRIAFSCSSVSFSGTSTSTCTMRSPTCSPFLIP
jgi:hypothetical protein